MEGSKGYQPKEIDTSLENQLLFVEFMIESNPHSILQAIKKSLEELKSIKEKK